MPSLLNLATAAHDLGMLLYGGPMVAFAVLISLSTRLSPLGPRDVVRTYRAWGAGLGLSMGLWVAGLLARHTLLHGSFTWSWTQADDRLVLISHCVFLVLWAFNVHLEIWALEPLRKLDATGGPDGPDAQPFAQATRRLGRRMRLQALLILAYVILQGLAAG